MSVPWRRPDSSVPAAPAALSLLAALNHEIRTPLSGILGMSDLLLETQLDVEQREYVTASRQCAEELFELLNTVLEFSALSGAPPRVDDTEFHLHELIESVMDEFSVKARARSLELESHIDAGIPHTVLGDAFRLRQLLNCLLRVALRFAGTGPLRFRTSVRDLGSHEVEVAFTVDDPSLMDTHRLAEFQRHLQLSQDPARQPSTGPSLALTLCSGLAGLLGGHFEPVVEPGNAIVLKLSLPFRQAADRFEVLRTAGPAWADRVLLVEDNPISQRVLGAMLAKGEYPFDVAADAAAALHLAESAEPPYALVLMDLQMPGMDGLQATERLRSLARYATVPIVALTAEVSDQIRADCHRLGMVSYLVKPVKAADLLAVVRKHTG